MNKKLMWVSLALFSSLAIAAGTIQWGDLVIKGQLSLDGNTASTVPYIDSSNVVQSSATTPTELSYLHGVTSAIQTQISTLLVSPLTTLGDIIYENATPTAVRLAGNTTSTKKYLSQTGTGTISAAPVWAQPACSDLSNAAASCSTDTTNASNITTGTLGSTVQGNITAVGSISSGTWGGTTVAVNHGGTGQTSYADGQLLIGNTSTGGLTKTTLSAGTNISITNGNGSISISGTGSSASAYNYTSQTSAYAASINDWVVASGASFTITLPTAVGQAGKSIVLQHNGISLSQVYTLNTTSGQTINGPTGALGSGVVALSVVAEKFILTADGANWQIVQHDANTGWIADTSCIQNYYTFTVSSASATIAATYAPAYVFTVTAASATVGATYTNSGHTYTVAATISGATTLVTTGVSDPPSSGTLTKSLGTGDATITFSAFTGQASSPAVTVAQTIASQLSLVTQSTSVNPFTASSGRLVKTAGTGDAVITYSALSGTYNRISATSSPPTFWGGSLISNTCYWKRRGNEITVWQNFSQGTAGAAAGVGDLTFPMPTGVTIDTTIIPVADTSTLAIATDFIELPAKTPFFSPGTASGRADTAAAYYQFFSAVPTGAATSFRIYGILDGETDPNYPLTVGQISPASIMAYNFQVILPVSGWLP